MSATPAKRQGFGVRTFPRSFSDDTIKQRVSIEYGVPEDSIEIEHPMQDIYGNRHDWGKAAYYPKQ